MNNMETQRPFRRSEAISAGWSRSSIDHRARTGEWTRIHRGIFAAGDGGDPWRSRLAAHLLRGGPDSAISHRAAARLHGFDGFDESTFEDLLVPMSSSFRRPPAMRSATLESTDVTTMLGLTVTNKVRTLLDLGRFAAADELELALESALRSKPTTPHEWDRKLLAELTGRAAPGAGNHPGRSVLRTVLARRPAGARATGSFAETKAIQALRGAGLGELVRQPSIRFVTARGSVLRTLYPDFGDFATGMLIEIDGATAHGTGDALRRDLRRQNELTDAFDVVRYAAVDVLSNPSGISHHAVARLTRLARPGHRREDAGESWSRNGWIVCRRSIDVWDVAAAPQDG